MNRRNRDNLTCLDLVKEQDGDLSDLLRGDSALLDAAKKGNLDRVKKLLTLENINCRDKQGRNSTPLHLAGGLWFSMWSWGYIVAQKLCFAHSVVFSTLLWPQVVLITNGVPKHPVNAIRACLHMPPGYNAPMPHVILHAPCH